jgi:hypothetical protein
VQQKRFPIGLIFIPNRINSDLSIGKSKKRL